MRSFLSTLTWNFRKNKLNTFIMVMGLSISFSLIIYISGYVHSELSYDSFIKDKDRIYRIYNDGVLKGNPLNIAVTRPSFTANLKEEIPEIESTVRVQMTGAQVKINESSLNNQRTIRTDENFFTFFDFPLIAKKNEVPLEDPSNVVISETLARNFFETPEEAIGQNIQIKEGNDYADYFVGGVFQDIEKNFHLDFQIVLSVQVMKDFDKQTSEFIYTYLKTKNPIDDHNAFDLKLTKYQYTHAYDDPDARDASSFEDLKDDETYLFILSEPLDEIHFSKHKFEVATTSDETYVYGAVVLALLVVIISFINYFNLSIATLSKRFKNFGIRKTLGASKRDIAVSFFYESMFIFLMIFFASWIVYSILKDPFSLFTGFHIRLTSQNLIYLAGITGTLLLTLIFISNFFSYLVVSRQSSQELLKKAYKNNTNQFTRPRNFFTVLQFTLSSFVIVATLLVNKQIQYFVKADKGFNAENILTFRLDYKNYNNFSPFIEELEKSPLIKGVSTSSLPFGNDPAMNALYFNSISNEHYFHSSQLEVDDGFAEVYRIELVEGRFFDKDQSPDYNEIVINESAAEKYMFEGSPLGNYVLTNGNNDVKYKIIGIAKDFNFRTLHHPIEPLILKREPVLDNFSLRIDNNQIKEAVQFVQNTLEKFSMGENFNYAFLNEKLAENYYQEARFRRLLSFISILAIFISCLGLFSIAQLTAIDKTKEIAIRKINGAKEAEILTMFNKVFVQWVAVAFIIALPISWYTMNKWLENFAYKTELSWWIFALAGMIALGIALLTVSWQSWKAATRNPVEALRYE